MNTRLENRQTKHKRKPMQTEIDKIKKRVEHIRAEINKPHRCGQYCLCTLLDYQLRLMETMIKKVQGYHER